MASAQNFVQNFQTRAVQHNHVVIKYQQPPDPAIVNHVLEILVATTRGYTQKNLVQIPYIPGLYRPNNSIFTNSL